MNQIFQFAFSKIRGIKVYALIGRAGTGKSYHSKSVADKYKIRFIIDDGLLIKDNKIIAGHSAKEEPDFLGAVRAAIFDNESHRNEITSTLLKEKYNKILIIGTSEKMVAKIAARLDLPSPSEIIYIEDIASKEDIENAMKIRYTEGKHVIPASPLEVTRSAPSIVYDTAKVLFDKGKHGDEKTIVKPEFSKFSSEEITPDEFKQMVRQALSVNYGYVLVESASGKKNPEGFYDLSVSVALPKGMLLNSAISEIQSEIIDSIEKYGGISIKNLGLEIAES